jgi:heme O synthase-like polyprenyltransferase
MGYFFGLVGVCMLAGAIDLGPIGAVLVALLFLWTAAHNAI